MPKDDLDEELVEDSDAMPEDVDEEDLEDLDDEDVDLDDLDEDEDDDDDADSMRSRNGNPIRVGVDSQAPE